MKIELQDVNNEMWKLVYELYLRTNNFVSKKAAKCIESQDHSFVANLGGERNE